MSPQPELPRNIYDQQNRNRRQTILVLVGFACFVALIGLGFDAFVLGTVSGTSFFPIGTFAGLAIGSVSASWSLRGGAKAVLDSARAVPVDPNDPRHRQLVNVVDEMRIASGMPMPAVYIVPDPDPNAFATGTTPETSVVAVTDGLLTTLNREELQGVVAHEMSHIRNADVRLMTVVAALVGTILILSDTATRSMRFGARPSSSSRKRSGGGGGGILFVLWIIAIILAPIIGQMLAMMVSRRREFLADASAAEMTRNPLGLASALGKLDAAVSPTTTIRKGSAHLCIVDPTGRKMNAKEGAVADLFGTHPPIQARIKALHEMGYRMKG